MNPASNFVHSRMVFAVVAASLLVAGCVSVPSLDDLSDSDVTRYPGDREMKVHATFDEVWPQVVDIVERRGYEEVDLEQWADEEVYRISGEQENQPREKQYSETVTEKNGRIVATTADDQLVPLELQEQHEWDMSVLDQLDAASGGDERYRLEHDGVRITVGDAELTRLDRDEVEQVFDAIHAHFTGDSP
jgi:hypothetical protein